MVGFGKKKTIGDYLYTRPVILVLCLIFLFLLVSVYERYGIEREMSKRRAATEQEKVELIERKEELEEKVEYLAGERGLEEEIRTHFDVAKEGEKVIILTGEEKQEIVPVQTEVIPKPWYKFW
jgi:cell division protein FtsB